MLHIAAVVFAALCTFTYVTHLLQQFDAPLQLPAYLTWTDEYKITGDNLRGFMKDAAGRSIYVNYGIHSEEEKLTLEQEPLVGRRYLVYGEMVEPSKPNHEYAFSMKAYLKGKGAIGIVEIANWELVETTSSIQQRIAKQRFNVKKHIKDTFPTVLAAEAQALIIGAQDQVEEETTRAYQKLGITHLFAISGLHIAIVALIFYQGILRLGVRREFASIFLMVILPVYAILAGGTPSVWRAVTVVELLMISRLKGRMAADDALAISFMLYVMIEPWSIYQIGFQLSYLATASLIYSGPFINRFSSWVVQSFLITFVCQLLVYPLLLYHFFEMSLSSFIVNIFFVPLFSFVILPINILLLISSYLSEWIAHLFFQLYEPLRKLLTILIDILQGIPYQMWNPGKPTIALIVFAYVSVFTAFYLLDVKAKLSKVLTALMLPAMILHLSSKLSNDFIISFISVGQGDCIVIELPHKEEVYLIDTGGVLRFNEEEWKRSSNEYEIGRDVVVPFLKGKGITKIDKLILTHADSDHVEGAEEILQEIRVKEINVTPNSYNEEAMNDLLDEARHQHIPIIEQIANEHWQIGDMTFTYLWPIEKSYEGNNDSLVLHVTKGDFEALFTGDLEEAGEKAILSEYPTLANVDVLKAGHHGSKTSSTEAFIERLRPALTIFSAGKNNRYGHPHEEVVKRFNDLGLPTLTTAEVGTIELRIGQDSLEVQTMSEE